LTRIVNSLTVKMEIGAPMASMYLLGNPDHYTDHIFKPFYWKNYIYASRVVDDYIYRPRNYSKYCLYDWVRLSRRIKQKCPKVDEDTQAEFVSLATDDVPGLENPEEDDMEEDHETDWIDSSSEFDDMDVINSSGTLEDDLDPNTEDECADSDVKGYPFLKDHPLYNTHAVHCVKENSKIVPNFIGVGLPRKTGGDDEYYSLTMLALFKPWRTYTDLKRDDRTWSEEFCAFEFTGRQIEVMKNFNVRYECLDARDDYGAQLRKNDANNG
ncbi:hypothetical protein GALMADRAFT_46254, partial [Galerina marginata CBS 339.88]